MSRWTCCRLLKTIGLIIFSVIIIYCLRVPTHTRMKQINVFIKNQKAGTAWEYVADLNNLRKTDLEITDIFIEEDKSNYGVWEYKAHVTRNTAYFGNTVFMAKYIVQPSAADFIINEDSFTCKYIICVTVFNKLVFRAETNDGSTGTLMMADIQTSTPLLLSWYLADALENEQIQWLHNVKIQLEKTNSR